jgi:Flp pilus assembly protein TadD
MGLFYLLTLYTAIRTMHSHKPAGWIVLTVICSALGMATKEVMITAPVMILLYDRTFVTSSFLAALKRRWLLYIGLAATWPILIAIMSSGPRSDSTGFAMQNLDVFKYARSQLGVIVHYLKLSIWPKNLCLDYSWRIADTWIRIVPPLLVILALAAFTLWGFFRNRTWAYPATWFFVILSPTSSIVPIADLAFEHRMYLPLAGVVILFVSAGYLLLKYILARFGPDKSAPASSASNRLENFVPGILAIVIIAALGLATIDRNNDYKTEISIWQNVVKIRPNNFRGHHNMARSYDREDRLDEALIHFQKAIDLNPGDPQAHAEAYSCFADVLKKQGKIEQAIINYNNALQIKPDHAKTCNNLGNICFDRGQLDEALEYYHKAVDSDANDADMLSNLGMALQRKKDYEQAAEYYRRALALEPDDAVVHNNFGFVLQARGKLNDAIVHFRRAVELNPRDHEASNNLGLALKTKGRFEDSIEQFHKTIRIKPDFAQPYYNLALTLASRNRLDEALPHFQKAVELKSDYAEAHGHLGNLYATKGNIKQAIVHFRSAVQIDLNFLTPLRTLAWILASHPDPEIRNGPEAVGYAEHAAKLTNHQDPDILATLAVAYAAAGQKEKARTTAENALKLAAENKQLVDSIRKKLRFLQHTKQVKE